MYYNNKFSTFHLQTADMTPQFPLETPSVPYPNPASPNSFYPCSEPLTLQPLFALTPSCAYCVCSLSSSPNPIPSLNQLSQSITTDCQQPNGHPTDSHRDYQYRSPLKSKTCYQQQTLGSRITKRNMRYFRELSNYSYSLENKIDPLTGKQYTAYICGHPSGCHKEFERPWNLLDHVRIHYDVRPHTCPFCTLTFVQKGNRNKHVLIHLKKGEQLPTNLISGMQMNDILDGKNYIGKYC